MTNLTRKEREKIFKRNEILKASLSIFAEKGFHRTTMSEISKQSQYPLGTIYNFFSGKDQIYHDMMIEKCRELGRVLLSVFEETDLLPEKRLLKTISVSSDMFKKNKEFIMLYISQRSDVNAVLDPELTGNINRMHEKLVEYYSDLFKEGADSGIFKMIPCKEVAVLFIGVLYSTTWFWLAEHEPDDSLDDKLNSAGKIFLKGICI